MKYKIFLTVFLINLLTSVTLLASKIDAFKDIDSIDDFTVSSFSDNHNNGVFARLPLEIIVKIAKKVNNPKLLYELSVDFRKLHLSGLLSYSIFSTKTNQHPISQTDLYLFRHARKITLEYVDGINDLTFLDNVKEINITLDKDQHIPKYNNNININLIVNPVVTNSFFRYIKNTLSSCFMGCFTDCFDNQIHIYAAQGIFMDRIM